MMSPKLSIIILNYRSESFVESCLRSIKKFPPSCSYELVVADNHSETKDFHSLQKKWQDKKNFPISFLAFKKNYGYGQGNNRAIKKAKGKFIAILNPDIEVRKNTLDILLDFLEKNSKVGIVGPRLFYPNDKTQDSFRRFPRISDLIIKRIPFLRRTFHERMVRFLMWDVDFRKAIKVDWMVGAFLVIKRQVWQQLDGFDKRYFLFFEDTDLCRQAREQGVEVYFCPQATATHNHTRLSETKVLRDFFRKKTFRTHIFSAFKYFWKWKRDIW